jgi:hypothetical protein
MKTIKNLLIGSLAVSSASATTIATTQDGWVDFFDGVLDGGTGTRLSIATPNPAGAFQYSRVAYFGFDVSSVNLADITGATFAVTTAGDIAADYDGATVRFTLVNNAVLDSFDQTTLESGNAPGLTQGAVVPGPVIDGVILGDVVLGTPASGETLSVTFPAAGLADLANDSNSFLTIVAESQTLGNAGYGNFTGIGFDSLESGNPATLTLIPEPSSALLVGMAGSLLLRRRRK